MSTEIILLLCHPSLIDCETLYMRCFESGVARIGDVEKCMGVIEHCQITDLHLRLPTGAHAPADPSSTYDCNIYMRFIYDQGHCNISCYMIY